MRKEFLVSVGEAVAMQGNNIVFTSKTLLDSGLTQEIESLLIRGGIGNQLQAAYYHSAALNVTLTDTQFRLPYIALNTGSKITMGGSVWANETVTLSGTTGTLEGTPVSIDGQPLAVWVEDGDSYATLPVTYSGGKYKFSTSGTSIASNSTICAMYMNTKNSAQTITIPANIVPERVRLYITAKLYGDISGSGFVGEVQIEIPVLQLSGTQEIAMTADGYSNTPLTGMAIAYSDGAVGCSAGSYYAKITKLNYAANWYDGITGLSIEGGDFTLENGDDATLRVWAVKGTTSFLCDNANLTFTSGTESVATIGANTGIVSTVSAGTTLLKAVITEKPEIEASCTLTVNNAEG